MQTAFNADFSRTGPGQQAKRIIRSCVHCGFCNAACPTYQLLGDELDGPRGRIYLIKQALEGNPISRKTQLHLDRCLTCLACESSCPSGVEYGRLLDIGRQFMSQKVTRTLAQRLQRQILNSIIPNPKLFGFFLRAGQMLRPWLSANWRKIIPPKPQITPYPTPKVQHARTMLLLDGCAQPALSPAINTAAIRIFDRLGITLRRCKQAQCCGAVSHHLDFYQHAKITMRRTIDAWWPHILQGVEAIVTTASGCGPMLKDYAYHLQDDADYASKAARISSLSLDISQVLANEDLRCFTAHRDLKTIALHTPCTLQYAQNRTEQIEVMLTAMGYRMTVAANALHCCGAAGTYTLLQKKLSADLLKRKLAALQHGNPDLIATANIGCLVHLQSASSIPVQHWIELLLPQ